MLSLFEAVTAFLWRLAEPTLLAFAAAIDRLATAPRRAEPPRPAPAAHPLDPAAHAVLEAWLRGKRGGAPALRQYRLFVDDAPSGRPWDEVSCLVDGQIEANTLVLQWSASGEIRVGGIVDVTRSDSSWGPALRLEGTVLWVGSETDALPARVVWLV